MLTRASSYAVEQLESRRLLATLNIDGTLAHDTIIIATLLDGIHVTINGDENLYSDLFYDSILVRGGPGNDFSNDTITVARTGANRITVDGNLGDDTLYIGTGDYEDAMQSDVYFEDDDGDDSLIINDSSGDGGEDYYLDPTYNFTGAPEHHAFANERSGESVYWLPTINRITILGSNGNDDMRVSTPRPLVLAMNITYMAGAGNDTIRYGSDLSLGDELEVASLVAMTVDGGAGNDKLTFDDRDPDSPRETYAITATHALNQRSTGFEQIEILSHPVTGIGQDSIATIGGNAGGAIDILVDDADRVRIGIAQSGGEVTPIDVDDAAINLRMTNVFSLQVYEQNAANPPAPWTYDWPRLHKGSSHIHHGNAAGISVFGGTSDDVFNVASAIPEASVLLNGGEGNDTCQTSNGQFVMQDNDLDDIGFASVVFDGGDGIDLIDLNDSADEIGEGDEDYLLLYHADTQLYRLEKTGALVMARFSDAERVNLVGDAESNEIRIRNRPDPDTAQYACTINGGAGADIIINDSPFTPTTLAGCSIIGGAGPDILIIDGGSSGNTNYLIDDFYYTIGAATNPPSAYDASVESVIVSAGNGNNHVRVTGKPTGTTLNVDGLAGDDIIEVGGGDIDDFGFAGDNTTVTGGAGVDQIIFVDHLDGPGEDENYLFDGLIFEKGGARLAHIGFDQMEVRGGRANSSYRISHSIMPTTILGGLGNDFVTFPPADLDVLSNRPLTVDLGAGSDTFVASDAADTGDDIYVLYSDRLEKNPTPTPTIIHYANVETFNTIGSSGNNLINPVSTRAGTSYTIDSNAGNDALYLGGDDISADLLGPVSIQGNAGSDTLYIDNSGDTTPAAQVLASNAFTDGVTHGYGGIEAVVITAGAGGGTLAINANAGPVTFNGGAGNDNVTIGNGNIDANNLGNITINGNGGEDHVLFDDRLDATGNDGYEFLAGDIMRKPLPLFLYRTFDANTVERRTLQATGGSNNIIVSSTTSELFIAANAGNDVISVLDSPSFVTVDTGAEAPTLQVPGDTLRVNADFNTTADLPASVRIGSDDRIAVLDVHAQGTCQIDRAVLDVTDGLLLDGVIDIAMRGAMIRRNAAGEIGSFATWLRDGYADGAWNGTAERGAINSSHAAASPQGDAVGYALASELFGGFPATFAGHAVQADDVLLRHTLYGDANLDLAVTLQDFNRLASNFGQAGRRWVHGDNGFDGSVNLVDFNRLAGNFGTTSGPDDEE